jgi:hypothetical protein
MQDFPVLDRVVGIEDFNVLHISSLIRLFLTPKIKFPPKTSSIAVMQIVCM